MTIFRVVFFIALLIVCTPSSALEMVSGTIQVASAVKKLVQKDKPQETVVTHLPTTTGGIAQKLSAGITDQVYKIDADRTEAEILKIVPNAEQDIAKKAIAEQRLRNKDLHLLIMRNALEQEVTELAPSKANVNALVNNITPLICAIKHGNNAAALYLLRNKANPHTRETETNAQLTPLHVAAQQDNLSIAKELVETYKADIQTRTRDFFVAPFGSTVLKNKKPVDIAPAFSQTKSYLLSKEPPLTRGQIAVMATVCTVYAIAWIYEKSKPKPVAPPSLFDQLGRWNPFSKK